MSWGRNIISGTLARRRQQRDESEDDNVKADNFILLFLVTYLFVGC